MTKLVRNHSHWGAFLAEVEDGRIVGVRPFEHDPDPSPIIEAVPEAVHSRTRIPQPMVREGWLKHGARTRRGPRPRAVRPGVVGSRARSRRRRTRARQARPRPRRHHGRFAGLGLGRNFPRGARAIAPLHVDVRRLRRPDVELQLRHRADVPAARPRQRAAGHRAADLVVVDRAPRQTDGAVRRLQSQEHAGDQRRLRRPFQRGPARRTGARTASRSSPSARTARMGPAGVARNGFRSARAPIPRCCSRWSTRW